MQFNIGKCKVMNVGTKNSVVEYLMGKNYKLLLKLRYGLGSY